MNPADAAVRQAALTFKPYRDDAVFKPGAGPQGGRFFLPFGLLRARFAEYGIALHTADRVAAGECTFELHINAQRRLSGRPAYVLLYEDPLIRPINANRSHLQGYRLAFTSNEDLVDGTRILKLDYPNDLTPIEPMPGWAERRLGCVLIAANKALRRPSPRNLHRRRVEIARCFERRSPQMFALYGRGWDQPAVRPGAWGRAVKRLNEWKARWHSGRPAFPSWRGPVHDKAEVLREAKFAIAFENVEGSPGYITEKIFDCFVNGCVPVYLGTPGAAESIPRECYIDARRFDTDTALVDYLRDMDEPRFAAHQAAIRAYLASPAAQRFSNETFTRTLVDAIARDQGLTALRAPPA